MEEGGLADSYSALLHEVNVSTRIICRLYHLPILEGLVGKRDNDPVNETAITSSKKLSELINSLGK